MSDRSRSLLEHLTELEQRLNRSGVVLPNSAEDIELRDLLPAILSVLEAAELTTILAEASGYHGLGVDPLRAALAGMGR